MSSSASRRSFLQTLFGLAAVSAVAPISSVARLLPKLSGGKEGGLLATYTISLADFPELAEIGGSVKLTAPEWLARNPDHVDWRDAFLEATTKSLPCKQGFYPIAVTRVAESGGEAFTAVSTFCPHEAEYQVNFDPLRFLFICCHQNSCFRPDGTWVPPSHPDAIDPTSPDDANVQRGLRKFRATFDGAETVVIDLEIAGAEMDERLARLLDEPVPNPARDRVTLSFTLPAASEIRLSLHAPDGRLVREVAAGRHSAGHHRIDVDLAGLPTGAYHYSLETPAGVASRVLTIVH